MCVLNFSPLISRSMNSSYERKYTNEEINLPEIILKKIVMMNFEIIVV